MRATQRERWPPKYSCQFFTYALLAANTNQAAEGAVGSPISESSTKINAVIGQYADFINASDLSIDVAIDNPSLLENLSTELNYRLALTLNTLVQLTSDVATGVDSSVNIQLANGSYLTANNLRTARQQLEAINARPFDGEGYMAGIIHPLVVHDLYNDTSINGLSDIMKRSPEMAKKLFAPMSSDSVVEFAGIRFKSTTTAPSVTISSNTYYNTYIYADEALFSIFLGKDDVTGEGEKNYKLNVREAPKGGSVSDPAGQIGGWVSYNVKYTNTLRAA